MKMSIRIPSLFLLFALAFTSCQKELSVDSTTGGGAGNNGGGGSGGGSGSGYYIKGKKDGVAFNFTANSMAKITSLGAGTGVTSLNLVAGVGGTSFEGFNIGINFSNGKTPEIGTYSEDDSSLDYTAAGVYNPNSADFVYGAGIVSPSAKPLVIKIVTKTSTEMTGTFEGAFYKLNLSSGSIGTEFVTFTEGEFKLKIQ